MQQDADFITADFLYMFRASFPHHQECKILTRQPPVQVVMVAGGSSLRHIRDETKVSSLYTANSIFIETLKHYCIVRYQPCVHEKHSPVNSIAVWPVKNVSPNYNRLAVRMTLCR